MRAPLPYIETLIHGAVDPHRLGEPASSSGATRGQEAEVSATLRQLAEQSRLHAGGAGADAGGNGILDDAMFDRWGLERLSCVRKAAYWCFIEKFAPDLAQIRAAGHHQPASWAVKF